MPARLLGRRHHRSALAVAVLLLCPGIVWAQAWGDPSSPPIDWDGMAPIPPPGYSGGFDPHYGEPGHPGYPHTGGIATIPMIATRTMCRDGMPALPEDGIVESFSSTDCPGAGLNAIGVLSAWNGLEVCAQFPVFELDYYACSAGGYSPLCQYGKFGVSNTRVLRGAFECVYDPNRDASRLPLRLECGWGETHEIKEAESHWEFSPYVHLETSYKLSWEVPIATAIEMNGCPESLLVAYRTIRREAMGDTSFNVCRSGMTWMPDAVPVGYWTSLRCGGHSTLYNAVTVKFLPASPPQLMETYRCKAGDETLTLSTGWSEVGPISIPECHGPAVKLRYLYIQH